MSVINICFLCPAPRVLTPELCEWHCRKNCKKYPTLGEKEQRRKQTTASLNDCFPGRAASPFFTSAIHRFHVAFCVFYIHIFFIYRMLRSPRSQIDIPMRIYGAPIPHCFIHLVISAANTQVDVFNLEMNVYCRVSVSHFQWCIRCRLVSMFALCSFNTMGSLIDWLNFGNN